MRTCITFIALILITCLTITTAEAKGRKGKVKKDKPLSGMIQSVAGDGHSMVLTIKGKKGAAETQRTITINASTTIEINGTSGQHGTDLQAGMKVKVKLLGDVAQDIVSGKVKSKKKK